MIIPVRLIPRTTVASEVEMLKSIVVSLTRPSGIKALTGFLSSSRAYCTPPPKAEGKSYYAATTQSTNFDSLSETKAEEPPQPIENIKSEKTGNITLIGINRAKVRNAINTETAIQLSEAIANFENDPESPVAVLYGCGGNFCAGYDLNELSNNKESVASLILRSEGAMVSLWLDSNPKIASFFTILGSNSQNHQKAFDRSHKRLLRGWWSRAGTALRSSCDGMRRSHGILQPSLWSAFGGWWNCQTGPDDRTLTSS